MLLGALGGFSDRSWVDLGRSWVTLSILGAILGALGFSLSCLGALWATLASKLIRLGLDETGWGVLLLALVLVLLCCCYCCCFDVLSWAGQGKVGEWDDLLPEFIFQFLFCTCFFKRFSLNALSVPPLGQV